MDINLLDTPVLSQDPPANRFAAEPLGFSSGHFLLIGSALVLFLVFAAVKGDLTWASFTNLPFLHASEEQKPVVTYESVRAEVEASIAQENLNTADLVDQQQQEELAQIDPAYAGGSVLGATSGDLPSADELMSQTNMQKIQVKTIPGTTIDNVKKYSEDLHYIEQYYDTVTLMNALATNDESLLPQVAPRYSGLITELGSMSVPDKLAEYHKNKILYYSALLALAQNMASSDGMNSDQAVTAGTMFFGLTDRLYNLSAQFADLYGVQL